MKAKQHSTKQPMDQWVKEEVLKDIKKHIQVGKNKEKTTHQNLWDAAAAVLSRKFILLNEYTWKAYHLA